MCILQQKIEEICKQTSVYDLFYCALNWRGERISNLESDVQYYEQLGIIPVYVSEYINQFNNENCADDIYPAIVKGA